MFMTHYMIVKFNDNVTDKAALCRQIEALFLPASNMPGIHKVQYSSPHLYRPVKPP